MTYLKNVSTIKLTVEKCTGCGRCVEVCPAAVFEMHNKKAAITDKDRCIECGACANNCAFDALSVDAGVGCAAAMINGLIKYGDAGKGTCDCTGGDCC